MAGPRPEYDSDEPRFLEEFGAQPAGRACPPLDQLLAANAGVLPDEVAAPLLVHLRSCASCAMLLRDFAASEVADLQPAGQDRIRKQIFGRAASARRRRFAVPLTVAAALAIGVTALLQRPSTPRPAIERPVQTATAAEMPPPHAPAIRVLSLEPAPVRLPAAMLTFRNDADRRFANDFGPAIALYRDGRYSDAAVQLEGVTRRHPSSAEAFLYLGVSQLFTGRPADAIASLQRARVLDRGGLSELIGWYLAIANEQTGNVTATTTELEKLCATPSSYSQRSCAALNDLRQR